MFLNRVLILIIALTLFACSALIRKQNMEAVLQIGHSSPVVSVAFSPDGRFVLSGSDDRAVKLWEVSTGREIRSFEGTDAHVTAVAYSPDGRIASVGYMDGTLTLWEVSTGRKILSLDAHSKRVIKVAFSPDGKKVISGSGDNKVKLWNISSGTPIRTFGRFERGYMETWYNTTFAFSVDGRFALMKSFDIQLWDLLEEKKIHAFPSQSMSKFGNPVSDAAFSPDGRFFLLAGTGLELWQVSTGRAIRTFEGRTYNIRAVAYSPDGRYAMTGHKDNALTLWNVSTGREIRSFAKHHSSIHEIVFSPNGRFVLVGYNDGTMILWEVSSGRKVRFFRGSSSKVRAAAYSPDGSLSLTGADNGDLVLWNVETGRGVKIFKGHRKAVSSIAFSPDGSLALSGSDDHTLKLWDVMAGKSSGNFYGHTDAITSVAFSPGGKFVLSASKDETCKLWDIFTKKEIRTFKGHSHWVNSVAVSPDGQTFVSGSSDGTIKLWDITTGREIRTFKDDTGWVLATAFSPDGRFILSGSWQVLTFWEVSSGRKIRTLKGHSGNITSVTFSSDGNYFLSGSDDHEIRLWNAFNGREIHLFKGHLDEVNIVYFSTNSRHVLSGSLDMTTRIWDVATGEEIIRMVASEDGEWLIVTPDGYYNTSPEGANLLHWVSPGGMETFTYEQFESSFKRPDIIKDRLAVNPDIGRPAPEMSTPPYIKMIGHLDITETHEKSYPLTLSVSALESVRTVRIFTNGKPTKEVPVNAKEQNLSLDIPLFAGANRITAVAYDDKGFSSNPKYVDVISKHAGLTKPNLHVLAIGVSSYPKLSPRWQLDYAHTDAQSLVSTLQNQEGKLFGEVRHNLLINEKVTVEKITDVMASLSSVDENDLLLIFMAGHGVKDKDGTFYFLTSEGSFQDPREGGLSWSVLRGFLSKIKGRVILMLDACHSGSVVTETVVPNDELAHKFFTEGSGGIMAFSASKGRQFSLESPDIGGGFGLFTYALVQSLGPNAEAVDTNNNNFVEFMELVEYVTEYVDDATKGEQTPWLSRRELFGDLPLARVN